MKFFGLRIREPKPDYLDAVLSLENSKRPPLIHSQNRSQTPEGSESPPSDASSQKSADSLTSTIQWTIQSLRDEVQALRPQLSSDSSDSLDIEMKFKLVELAISDIGMGMYQWQLFGLCGIGWAADNLWVQGVALILPALADNFDVSDQFVRYATLSLNVGLSIGAAGWGIGSDIKGRKSVFNLTLFFTGLFAFALSRASSFVAACSCLGALGVGIGGSLPVDGTLFLEFLPHENRSYLTLLSIWWPVGQVLASGLAWKLFGKFGLTPGWMYFIFVLGGITLLMALVRLLSDNIESPKYLLGINKQAEAVRSVRALAHKNSTQTWLTEEILNEIGGTRKLAEEARSSTAARVREAITSFGPETRKKVSSLFGTTQLGWNTGILWFIWICLGMGYPLFNAFLPQYLSNGQEAEEDSSKTYRNYAIISAVAVPGSVLACFLVEKAGRRIPMAISTMITGIFFFLFTIRNESMFQLAFGCVASIFQNIMFGILYAYTPETFPGPSRGTGCGIAHSLSRLGGICAPLIAANVGASNPSVPIYVSGSLILAAFVAMCFLRIETQNRQSL